MPNNANALLSVIMPVYNASAFLNRSVQSILKQSYENIELITVNDGSTDNSLEILYEIKNSDERIIVINQDNQGPSAARNSGLKRATGDYIAFVDADDAVESDAYEKFIATAERTNADIVECGIYIHEGELQTSHLVADCEKLFETNNFIDIYREFLFVKTPTTAGLWNKLYKRETLIKGNVQFNKSMKDDEDWVFNCDVLTNVNKYCKIDYLGYHYFRDNPNSITFKNHQPFIDALLFKHKMRKKYVSVWGLNKNIMQQEININFINNAKWLVLYNYWHRAYVNLSRKEKRLRTKELMLTKELIVTLNECTQHAILTKKQKLIIWLFNKKQTTVLRWLLLVEWQLRKILSRG